MRNQPDLLVTNAIPGTEAWNGHRLVISKLRARIQPLGKSQENSAAKQPPVVNDEDAFIENRMCQPRDTVESTAPDVLDRARDQNQDFSDDNDDDDDDDDEAAIGNLHSEKN
nr:unnamed protein product [Spirometra erinaceieuropaei]